MTIMGGCNVFGMRMNLTKEADYGVRAVLDIAGHHPDLRTTRRITAAMDIPRNFLSHILATLVRHDVLKSKSGPAGGYTLGRPASEITLLEVIEIIEGPVGVDECILGGGTCDWTGPCPLHHAWAEAKASLANHLATINFGDLADIDVAIRTGTYQLPDHSPPHPTPPPRLGTSD